MQKFGNNVYFILFIIDQILNKQTYNAIHLN